MGSVKITKESPAAFCLPALLSWGTLEVLHKILLLKSSIDSCLGGESKCTLSHKGHSWPPSIRLTSVAISFAHPNLHKCVPGALVCGVPCFWKIPHPHIWPFFNFFGRFLAEQPAGQSCPLPRLRSSPSVPSVPLSLFIALLFCSPGVSAFCFPPGLLSL